VEPTNDLDPSQAIEPVGPRQLWDKRPDESQRAFDAFVRYRDAEKRSFKNIADQLNCSPQNIFQWSSKFNWRLRCDAFDLEQDRIQREELARGRMRMRERHLRLALSMQGIAAHAIREWQARIASGTVLNLAPEQIALLTKCSVELERTAMGVEREHQYTTINVVLGQHRYPGEQGGEDEGEPKLLKDFEAEEYEKLDADERAALDSWRDPPKRKALN